MRFMAETGIGRDKCLAAGCYPMEVHFYQPVPDIQELERRDVWSKVSALSGIKWETDKYLAKLAEVSRYKPKRDWPDKPESNMDFGRINQSFSYICASLLYGMILKNKPKRIIEIGSGNSSKVVLKALQDSGKETEYTIIDPYCCWEETEFGINVNVIQKPVEETNIALFQTLETDDILFIDSSHTVRIGGDVNFLILDILPLLAQGVIVHFHDIELPYEYSKVYATNLQSRKFWTESYLLQAFLTFNTAYEILLPAVYLCREYLDTVKECYPGMRHPFDWSSSSFWIRRTNA